MSKPDINIGIGAEFVGKSAFKQAEKGVSQLTGQVGKLASAFGIAFGGRALINYGKQAAKAFAADEKAARSLGLALANTGNAFAAIEVEKFIGDLQRATGVVDDQLRPAFRSLLTATGSVKKSQDGLALALDIAAGTGKDLGAVSMALAKAYGGQTTALSRLGAGLSKATLASGDLDLITKELSQKFSGQALTAAEGYAGSMAKLTVASENAKEIIGKDLLDAMQLIAGKDGIGGATTAMEGFATQIGNAIYGIAVLTNKIQNIPLLSPIFGTLRDVVSAGPLGGLSRLGANAKARSAGTPAQSPGQRVAIDRANKDALRIQKEQNNLKKIDNEATARKIVLTGDQLALLELEKKFDVERVGLYAALNQSADSETKMRLLSLIAIKDQNEALAGMIKKANEAGDAFGSLIEAIRASIRALLDKVAAEVAQLQKLTTTGANTPIEQQRAIVREKLNLAMPDITALQNNLRLNASSINTAGSGSPTYIINAQGIGDQQIASVVQGAIQDLNRYGNSTTYAGAI
jgi:hypothetical protein